MVEKFLHHGYLALPAKRPYPIDLLNSFFKIYDGASPVDRTNTITFPTRMKSLFPLPKMQEFHKNYHDICRERAFGLIRLARDLDISIYVFWSGGVDSTCALVSLLEQCNERDRIVVLMTEQSVSEYPLFYFKYIRGKLRCLSADILTELFATKALIVNGEHNDQLFGSDIIGQAFSFFGADAVLGPLQREFFTSLYEFKLGGDRETALFFSGLFGRLVETAPISLKTNFDLLWWINFAIKWQTVYMRSLIFSKIPLQAEQVLIYYHPFFGTADFQLWSMNNLDQKIKRDWRSYKWPAKQVIYEFTKDANYRDGKLKRKSLEHLVLKHEYHKFLDENFAFREEMDWYEPQSDFHTNAIRSEVSISL